MREDTIAVCGLKSVRALFGKRPGAILRLFFNVQMSRQVGPITQALAEARKVYRVVEDGELEKLAATVHHGGIVAIIGAIPITAISKTHISSWAQRKEPLLLLDRVGNPHNLGAIVRTAAWFGIKNIIIPDSPGAAVPSEAAWRVSEGGMAFVNFFRCPDLAKFCTELSPFYNVLGAAVRGNTSSLTNSARLPAIVLGNEEEGLSESVMRACTHLVTIPGSGQVESLNVSAAAAILLWQYVGAHEGSSPRKR